MLGGCGLRGTLKTPPPLWEKTPTQTPQETESQDASATPEVKL
jgi:predicted small lipoprotein YifL